ADELRQVEIESPRAWYFRRLRVGESIVRYSPHVFVDDQPPGFEFYVMTPNEPNRPTYVHVVGTYKIDRESHTSKRSGQPPINTWTFVPATAELKPMLSR